MDTISTPTPIGPQLPVKNFSLLNPTRQNVTKVLCIVSKETGLLRRTIDADNDEEYEMHEKTMHPGEMAVYLTHAEFDPLGNRLELHDYVAFKSGHGQAPDPSTTRHAVVDQNGNVVNIIHADLSCGDSGDHIAPGHTLHKHSTARVGWKLKHGKLVEK